MQNSSATATIIGWLDLSIPDQKLHFDLVQVLYRTPKSIFGATIVSLLVMAIATAMSGDPAFEYFFAGFVLVGGARIGTYISITARSTPSKIEPPRHDGNAPRC